MSMAGTTTESRAMNSCFACKTGKRRCDRARPSCANCFRLSKNCVYEEDTIQSSFYASPERSQLASGGAQQPAFEFSSLGVAISPYDFNPPRHEPLHRPAVDIAVRTQARRIFGSIDMSTVWAEFFDGTHQRLSALSKSRFYRNLSSMNDESPADFVALCLCIYLLQQTPPREATTMQSSFYATVKSVISLLEAGADQSLDTVHCRLLLTLYELGHGLHTAAYISIAACARSARALGLHRKPWLKSDRTDKLEMEEEKRLWWAIVNADRFIGLCNGDPLFTTDDPASSDPLPIQDSLWLNDSVPPDYEVPVLATPAHITIGQMARECQVAHLTGRVVKHVFDPTPDLTFNAEEAVQLERTLKAFLPLLADEDLRLGKYCGALGMCHSALYVLYEFTQNRVSADETQRNLILEAMDETSTGVFDYTKAHYSRPDHFNTSTYTPFLAYAYFQSGIIQYRRWQQSHDPIFKERVDTVKVILEGLSRRWLVAKKYLRMLSTVHEDWPLIILPPGVLSAIAME